MARDENPPFARGSTFSNTYGPAVATGLPGAVAITDGQQYEGKQYKFEDVSPLTPLNFRSNRYVICRVVRNVAGFPLLPGRIGKLDLSGTILAGFGARVQGYTASVNDKGFPIDEYLPAAGVQPNDLFYVVTEGPAAVLTDPIGGAPTNVPIGGAVVPSGFNQGYVVNQDTTQLGGARTVPTTNTALFTPPVAVPTINPIGGGGSGGLLQAGTYFLKYTFVNAQGETTVSPESAQFTVVAGQIPQVTLPALPSGITSINLYLTAPNGASGSETKYATGIVATTANLSTAQSAGTAQPVGNTATLANASTAPTIVVGSATTGMLQPGTYFAKYTWTTALGETVGSSESTQFTVTQGLIPQLTVPALPAGALAANIYLTQPGGASGSEILYMQNVVPTVEGLGLPEPLGATLYNQLQNAIGRSLQAINAANTNVVVDVGANNR